MKRHAVAVLIGLSLVIISSSCFPHRVGTSFTNVDRPVLLGRAHPTTTPFTAEVAHKTANTGHMYSSRKESAGKFGVEALRALRKSDNSFIVLDSIEVNAFEFGLLSKDESTSITVKGYIHEKAQ